MKFDLEMQTAKTQLEAMGYEVEKPNSAEDEPEGVDFDKDAKLKKSYIDEHFRKIDDSDAILVVNMDKNDVPNYIGGNTLIEIAYAYAQGLEVFLLNAIPDVSYVDEIRGMHPIILDGNITALDEYFNALPLVMMSTESPVKHRAVSRGLRRAGIKVRTEGKKIESGVQEQPASVNETYEGAVNRHQGLSAMGTTADYLVTIESGQHQLHADHNVFGCSVIIFEKVGNERKIGIDFDVELPKSMTDRIPAEFPDAGVLVQKVYGSKLKDPFPYFTNNKLTRTKILESAVYNIAVQL